MVSFLIYDFSSLSNPSTILEIVLLIILTAPLFFLHEIGHKINAQKFNLWAEFRLDQRGVLITAISIILPIKFIAPGAVQIRANDYSEIPAMGKVAGYGPAVNIMLGGLFLIITGILNIIYQFTSIDPSLLSLLLNSFFYATGFSFFLGLFNMLPFGPLDGWKVKYWNDRVFWALLIISGLLALETYGSYFLFNQVFLIGTILNNQNPFVGTFYPFILGVVVFAIGIFFLKKLADPNWDPGRQPIIQGDYRDYHYYQSPPIQTTRSPAAYHSSNAPMNTPCAECGKRDLLPFKCTTCGKIYCAEHRLPGKHFCVVDANYGK